MSAFSDAERTEQDQHKSADGEDPMENHGCPRDVLLSQLDPVRRSIAAHRSTPVLRPSPHQEPAQQGDRNQSSECNPGHDRATGHQMADPQDQTRRGQPEVSEDPSRRKVGGCRTLTTQPTTADPADQHEGPDEGGDDPGDQSSNRHLVVPSQNNITDNETNVRLWMGVTSRYLYVRRSFH